MPVIIYHNPRCTKSRETLALIEKKGIEEARTILIPAFFAAGMLLFSNYAGRLGDRRGHLGVMRALASCVYWCLRLLWVLRH